MHYNEGPDYLESDADLYEHHHHTCECSLCKPELAGPTEWNAFHPWGTTHPAQWYWRVETDDES